MIWYFFHFDVNAQVFLDMTVVQFLIKSDELFSYCFKKGAVLAASEVFI